MDINQAFPSKYLKASDLRGQAVDVTIGGVKLEKVGDDDKPCLYFNGKEKGVVLNKINSSTIAVLYGDETDGWTDKPITLYPDKTNYEGKIVDCIRMRGPIVQAEDGEEVPF